MSSDILSDAGSRSSFFCFLSSVRSFACGGRECLRVLSCFPVLRVVPEESAWISPRKGSRCIGARRGLEAFFINAAEKW